MSTEQSAHPAFAGAACSGTWTPTCPVCQCRVYHDGAGYVCASDKCRFRISGWYVKVKAAPPNAQRSTTGAANPQEETR